MAGPSATEQHPAFDAALADFCEGVTEALAGDWLGRASIPAANQFTLVTLIVWGAAKAQAGGKPFGPRRLVKLLSVHGLGGERFARDLTGFLSDAGLIAVEPNPRDRRAVTFRPTPALLARLGNWASLRLAAAARVHPDAAQAAEAAAGDLAYVSAYVTACVDAWGSWGPAPLHHHPDLADFARKTSAIHLLLALAAATTEGGALAASPRQLAERLHVSREHVRDLLADARARGWLKPEDEGYALTPAFSRRLRAWIAAEIDWTAAVARTCEIPAQVASAASNDPP